MGMGWSGSSAIIDAMVDQINVKGINNGYPTETSLFGKKSCPLNYLNKFTQSNRLDKQGLLATLTRGTRGLESSIYKKELIPWFNRLDKREIMELNNENFSILRDGDIYNIFDNILGSNATYEVDHIYEKYYYLLASLLRETKLKQKSNLVLNNDPSLSGYMKINKMLPEEYKSENIVVHRNMYDMLNDYVSRLSGTSKINKKKLILRQSKKKLRYGHYINSNSSKFFTVKFEKFIESYEYRNKLLKIFNAKYNEEDEELFIPKDSIKNINMDLKSLSTIDRLIIKWFDKNYKPIDNI